MGSSEAPGPARRPATWSSSPSNRTTSAPQPRRRRCAFSAMVSNTGWTSFGELAIARRISAVAVSRACASASCSSAAGRRFSRSTTLAPAPLGDWLATGGLASLDFAGFGSRRISLPLPYESAGDRLGERVRLGNHERRGVSGGSALATCSRELSHLRLHLLQPVRHPHLAVHRHRGREMLLRMLAR